MALQRLRIRSFRCITEAEIELHPTRNYLFGPNGAGKTTLLEAIHLLGRGRSFRTRQTRLLVQRGQTGFSVYGEVERAGQRSRLGVGFDGRRLEKKLDGQPAAMADLARALPVHVIDPSVHALVEGAASERRRHLDWGVFHVEPDYLGVWRRYRRVLGQRNAALRHHCTRAELDSWDRALVEAGEEIDRARRAYVEQLSAAVSRLGLDLLDRALEIVYRPGWQDELTFAQAVAETEARDRLTGSTLAGPHRADLDIRLETVSVKGEASRGEQKLVAATLVLAQAYVYAEAHPGHCVLLVDDPAAELDANAVERLLCALARIDAQLVLTGLSPSQLAPLMGFPVFHVEQGRVQPVL